MVCLQQARGLVVRRVLHDISRDCFLRALFGGQYVFQLVGPHGRFRASAGYQHFHGSLLYEAVVKEIVVPDAQKRERQNFRRSLSSAELVRAV